MTEIPQDVMETIVSHFRAIFGEDSHPGPYQTRFLARLVLAEREALAKEIGMLRADNAAAWDKCEERRLEAAAARKHVDNLLREWSPISAESIRRDARAWLDATRQEPPVERSPRHYDSQGYCDNPGRGY